MRVPARDVVAVWVEDTISSARIPRPVNSQRWHSPQVSFGMGCFALHNRSCGTKPIAPPAQRHLPVSGPVGSGGYQDHEE